jgi:hypothetical protein
LKLPLIAAAVLASSAAFAQEPILYGDFKAKRVGAAVDYRIDSFKRLGLDLGVLIGGASKSEQVSDFTGVFGLDLSARWSLPKSPFYFRGGVVGSWSAGEQFSGGVFVSFGFSK